MNTTRNINYLIAKNMISINNESSKIEDSEIDNFICKYKEIIDSVIEYMPRGMTSVASAVAKCAIQYNKDKAISFLKNSKERIFQGKEDPVYHFYMWLHGLKGPKRKKDISTYEITMYACKQYCEGKQIKRLIRYKDKIGWAKDWEIQKKTNKNKETDPEMIFEFIKKLNSEKISTNDFVAALKLLSKKE